MNIKVYTLNSFAKTEDGGNPAGIVFDADFLTEEQMKQVASIVGFSETAFVSKSEAADFKVRFFTPVEEVDLCGHATIGTYYTMSKLNLLQKGNYKQETKAGILGIKLQDNDFVMMEQTLPEFYEAIDKDEIADSLNLNVSDLADDLPAQIVSTGLRDIIVPVKNEEILHAMNPDMDKVSQVSRKYHPVGYHVFAMSPAENCNAYCRNLAPLYGIPEEAATGTSNGALGSYLFHHKAVSKEQAKNLIFRQGYSMKKPSEIHVSLTTKDSDIIKVEVGGSAMNLSSMEIEI